MRLFHVELESQPALGIDLHPRLTVVAADVATRARIVDAFDALLRGRASGLRGALVTGGAVADFVVESTSGPVLPGVPTIVRAGDLEILSDNGTPSASERAEARHTEAMQGLRLAEAAHSEQQRIIEGLLARGAHAAGPAPAPPASVAASGVPGGAEADECRRHLRAYLDELEQAVDGSDLDGRTRVHLLERGTVLAAEASRLGVCGPASVRALLDAVDALSQVPSYAGGGGGGASRSSAPVGTLVREVVLDLDTVPEATNGDAAAELARAEERLGALEEAVGAARSRALAVFAELESVRRAAGPVSVAGGAFSQALRARLNRPTATSWVGPSPVLVDDVLAPCPADDLDAARAVLLEAAQRAQVIYLTADETAIAWASQLAPDDGLLTQPTAR
jgi:hypothetical protein